MTEHNPAATSHRASSPRAWQRAVKRALDLVLGGFALVLFLPVMALVAMAVAVDSTGPVIFGAHRVGRGGREFTMWKFRSMARGSERAGPTVTGAYDWRVTRVGVVLRRTKLDELPQLLNVIAGQMSLVGPRPESPKYVALYGPAERHVLSVRPGITGPAQIAYVHEEELLAVEGDPDDAYTRTLMHAKLEMDLDYVHRYRLRRDVGILWRTLVSVVSADAQRGTAPARRHSFSERLRAAGGGALALDAVLAAGCAALAIGLRLDRANLLGVVADYWVFVPLSALVRPAGFVIVGAYLRVWRYPTVSDVGLVISSLAAGTLVMALSIFVVMQPSGFPSSVGFPRSALVIEFMLAVLVLGGVRIASRVRQEELDPTTQPSTVGPPRPVVIVGAGEAGALLVREMRRNRALRLEPVAFLDDDARRHGQRIYGVDVAGSTQDLPKVVADRGAFEVIVAQPRMAGAELRRIVALCEAADVAVRTLPAVDQLLDESVTVNRIRPVRVEDLLQRQPNDLPGAPMRALVAARVMLVTGAAGSIGSEACRQAAVLGARKIVLVDRAESPLFFIDEELGRRHPSVEIVPILADVTNVEAMTRVFATHRPDVVLHAAAYKHVPLSERNVSAAALTNVRGTRVIAEAAAAHGTDVVIFVSTDKAVDPSSVMGQTKRVAERLFQEIGSSSSGRYIVVRFGNVLGSQGSVLELFRQQIADGGPVTVTDPDITRFFMTIPEAVRLTLFAGAIGEGGRIHVLDMGQPIRIVDLARDLIRLSSPAGAKDIQITFTGLRPGEKLHEELFGPEERPEPTEYSFLLVARQDQVDRGSALDCAREIEELSESGNDDAVRARLSVASASTAAPTR